MKCALFFPRFSGQSWIRRESCKYNLIKDNRRFCEKNARVLYKVQFLCTNLQFKSFTNLQGVLAFSCCQELGFQLAKAKRVPSWEAFFGAASECLGSKKKILKKHVKFLVLGVLSEVLRELLSEHDMTPKNVSQARIGTCSHHKTSMM